MNSSDFFNRPLHRKNLFTLSPTLVDPALVSVIRAVDGQETGLSVQPAEKKNRLQTGQEFHLQSASSSSTDFTIEGDISPSLADPALLSVVGVVDGQFTGFITKEGMNFIYRAHRSRLLCFKSISRPAS